MKTFATIVLIALLAIKGITGLVTDLEASVQSASTTYHNNAETAYNEE